MFQDMERQICATAGLDEPDFEDIYHTSTDEELEHMADVYARTHHEVNTTPIYATN